MDLKKIGETKVTVPLILLAGLLWLGWNARDLTIDGLDQFFFTDAAAGELAKAVQVNGEMLAQYIQKQELRDVNEQIEQVGSQITETQLWVAANGANPIATARLGDLVKRRRQLESKRACMLNNTVINKDICDAY